MKLPCKFDLRVGIILASLALPNTIMWAQIQAPPTVQGTFVADPAVPTIVSPTQNTSQFFVLNQDLSVRSLSDLNSGFNASCTPVAGLSVTGSTVLRTLANDNRHLYLTALNSAGSNLAVTGMTPLAGPATCGAAPAVNTSGGVPSSTLTAADGAHNRLLVVNARNGIGADTITTFNTGNVEGASPVLTQAGQATLDTNAQYTSVVADADGDFALTAVTELRTATSPGNLWVYTSGSSIATKILAPGGGALPALGAFMIHNPFDAGGSLLVLINQDNLTSTNLSSPPQDTTPFTIIDLGQLQSAISNSLYPPTLTLPFVTRISATLPYYAMLGAVYNPVNRLLYALVAGGTSSSSVFGDVISYNPLNASSPAETVVADVSSIPFTPFAYPQLALNAASSSLQILTPAPFALYTVGIQGTGNTAGLVTGTPFSDSSFQPTFVAANPLVGETYIASKSGQIDIITRPVTLLPRPQIVLRGVNLAQTGVDYEVGFYSYFPVNDAAINSKNVVITATPQVGSPVQIATPLVGDTIYPGSSVFFKFTSPGLYSINASYAGDSVYAAASSNTVTVNVSGTGFYRTASTILGPATAAAPGTINAIVQLSGTTYSPTGTIIVTGTGATIGTLATFPLPAGVIANPLTIPVTLATGVTTLTAAYSGDAQNKPSTSAAFAVTVGTTKLAPTLTLAAQATGTTGASIPVTATFAGATPVPTGNIVLLATLSSNPGSPLTFTIPASQAAAAGGAQSPIILNVAGTYTLSASYAGDANYNSVTSAISNLLISASTAAPTTLTVTAPAATTPGTTINAAVALTSTATGTPTGNVILTYTPAVGAATTVATITAAQAFAPGGKTVPATIPGAGIYTLTATYAGDTNFAATTGTVSVTVTKFASTLTLTTAPTVILGNASSLLVTLTAGTTIAPTGNIVITAALGAGQPVAVTTFPATQAFSTGGFTSPATLAAAGIYTLTATYPGDSVFAPATTTATVTVTSVATSLSLSGASTAVAGTPINLIAMLTGTTGVPAGNITVTAALSNGTGTPVTVATTALLASASGGTSLPITLPSAGTYLLTANYPGDSGNSGATSAALSVVASAPAVLAKSFTFVPLDPGKGKDAETALGLNYVGYTEVSLNLNAVNGYSTPVTFTIAYRYPDQDPPFIAYIGDSKTHLPILTATPTAAGTEVKLVLRYFSNSQPLGIAQNHSPLKLTVFLSGGFLGLSLLTWRKRNQPMGRTLFLLLAVCIIGGSGTLLSGCRRQQAFTITATPTNASQAALAQTITYYVEYQEAHH